MYSWKLFSHTVLANKVYQNPIYLRELKHDPIWYRLTRQITLPDMFQIVAGVGIVLAWGIAVLFVGNLLFFFVPPLLLLMFVTALTVGPLIVEERVNQSWETLLTVPLGMETVVVGKIAGALWWTRHVISMVTGLIFMISAGAGFISLILIPIGTTLAGTFQPLFLCGSLFLLPLVSCTIFILDRIQQYMLIVAAALTAGTMSSSVRAAFSAASTAVLLVWLSEVLVAGAAIALHPGGAALWTKAQVLLLVTTGPLIGFMLDLPIDIAAAYLILTWLIREVAFGVLWRVSLHHARFDAERD